MARGHRVDPETGKLVSTGLWHVDDPGLRELAADFTQGYFLSHPLPPDLVEPVLNRPSAGAASS